MKLIFSSDHAGFLARQSLAEVARAWGHDVTEVGAPSEASYDYPEASDLAVERVLDGSADFGILICGSGIGVSIRANRYHGIRAALCMTVEMAELARMHNHANVLCLASRLTPETELEQILSKFLTTAPDEGERHVRRIRELDAPPLEAAIEGSKS